MAEEEEIRLEVEAAMAVYGDDCRVVREFPPHLALHVRPRTADDSSQQFVEAILAIKSSTEYPNEPPHVYAIETKGLDENRKTYLITSVQQKAQELSSCPMLVALCEEAVEILSSMNHPDGDCPLCLYPLVVEMAPSAKWHQSSRRDYCYCRKPESSDMHEVVNQHEGNCPVCRKVFDEKDLEHVLGDLETDSFQLGSAVVSDIDEEEKALLQSESENHRRQQFEVLIKLQQESDGLIEPKKDLLILPGMFLPATSVPPSTSTEVGSSKQSEDNSCSSTAETDSNSSPNKATTNNRTSLSSRRKHKGHRSRKQQHAHFVKRQQWIRKEEDGSEQ